jgi:Family of unknown function (DUF6807)
MDPSARLESGDSRIHELTRFLIFARGIAMSRSWLPRLIVSVALFACSSVTLFAGDDLVKLNDNEHRLVQISIGGSPFATFNWSGELPKPFLLPVRTASGTVINRGLNDPSDPDHPHHKGLWLSVDEVNGLKYWNEDAPIRSLAVRIIRSDSNPGILETVNQWRHPETDAVQLTETSTISIFANRLLVYDILLTASHREVTFDDTKEGLLGFRVAPSMKEKNGGTITASDGSVGESNCWGKTFDWIDYSGEVDGNPVGVTLMDHPGNLRPSRYHVRSYGLFSINPFGEKAYTKGENEEQPVHLAPGESLRLRYGVYFHDGDLKMANVAATYQEFLKAAGK